jgi:predicted RNase H-like nuclease (RuvC/YqgF family)
VLTIKNKAMNIDLRNISDDFERQVNEVKKSFEINTNSKAVEFCVINYFANLKEIENLKRQLNNEKQEHSILRGKLLQLKELFAWINK